MKRIVFFTLLFSAVSNLSYGQFHTMKIPRTSPKVTETQRLGITDITISYSSPALRDRDVWNSVIPQGGNPIAWRAGANMSTTIDFSTDVLIEGQALKAGRYGFHVIPENDNYTLLFVQPADQWGSYYLDVENDTVLKVTVGSETCSNTEQLDYEFLSRSENSLVVGLEWGDRRIPFTVEVDLISTVVKSFREELRGINTYHWQAWNDAALWCLDHNTNLEEALSWASRSIEGGYGGFAANKNVTNLSTKMRILKRLGKDQELSATIEETKNMPLNENDATEFGIFLLRLGSFEEALSYSKNSLKNYPEAWSIILNKSIANYFLGNSKAAIKDISKVKAIAPQQVLNRLNEIENEFKNNSFQIRGSYN